MPERSQRTKTRTALATRPVLRLFAALVVLLLGGCANGTGPGAVIYGTYNLVEVDGEAVPYKMEDGTVWRSGSFTLNEDRTFLFRSELTRPISGRTDTVQARGTFAIQEQALTLATDASFVPLSGTIRDERIALDFGPEGDPLLAVFRR